jgi:hypothetical protein
MGVSKNHNGHWWRAYAKALHDPKLQSLSGDLFKSWFNLACMASTRKGELPSMFDVAFNLRLTQEQAESHIASLISARLIDRRGSRLSMHDWKEFQYQSDTSAERTKKWRERHGDGPVTSQDASPPVACDGFDSDTGSDSDTNSYQDREDSSKLAVLHPRTRGAA